ncbi:unnamed protein product [Psylliodes chrysocephalus]|uniref:Phenoloxidase-activating factor 2 n=1 Tax=Psylliodes chrysocephalus TaxID=3402493 RepID=A0A9P0CW23_9CUCU|nr:unnamed protein product [Psylliodes chrysocephala]
MRLPFYLAAIILLHRASSEEQSWSWGSDQKDASEGNAKETKKDQTDGRSSSYFDEDLIAAPSEFIDNLSANSTEAGQIIDEIISSTREGRAIDGFDEVYSDPNVQDALQKGDDSEARNIIKDRLCALGLMQCEDLEGKRPYYSPEELIYAQPISINPVGKPIPTIPIKGVRGIGGYGPPKPLPYPSTRPHPPGKYPSLQNKYPYPGSSNSFSPQGSHQIQQGGPNYFQQGKPPRRHFGVPPSKPFYGKPSGLNGEVYEGAEFFGSKPPSFIPGANEFSQPLEPEPYKYVQQSAGQFAHINKDKRVEITVNAQGGTTATVGGVTPGTLEHVHHHYHHNAEGSSKPVVINPIPIASAAVSTSDLSSHSFNSANAFGSFKPSASVSTSVGLGSFGSTNGYHQGQTLGANGFHQGQSLGANGFQQGQSLGANGFHQGQTLATNGYQQGTYGGQSIANYGVKPVNEGYPEQSYDSFGASVGAYGTTGLYKKELNLNSGNSNYLQSGYADKYQGLESARAENYDCVCVPYDQCPTHDVLGRKDDLYLPLDPRNLKTDIEALSDEERVITDGNGTMTVIKVGKNGTSETNQEVKKISKREAPVDAPVKDDTKPEARQFYGGNGPNGISGRPQTCGPRHVCCKRPLRPQVPNVNKQCGTRHSQGINGRIKNPVYIDGDSEFGEYPWQVAILKKDSKESVYVCGGTLIDHLHILTAAHCVKTYTGFDLRARLGEWDVNHDVEFYPYIERDVVSVQVHPEFYAGTLYNDIAILRMDSPVDWSKYPHISPACLPHPHDDYTGTRCWTTGWGKDAFGDFGKYQNILKEVDVPVIGNDLCQRQLQSTRLGYDFKLHPGFVCAGGEEGKDACKGDGGGPMVCERGGTWQVVGLVSWGIGCGQNGIPGVYVKVGHYVDWIRQVTQRY